MKNRADYEAGFTKPIAVPGKDRPLSGGAARNFLLARTGGVSGAQDRARVETLAAYNSLIEPIFQAQSKEIQQLKAMVSTLIETTRRDGGSITVDNP